MKWVRALRTGWERYERAQISTRAAALAFHTLLGIVPTVGMIFWYLKTIRVTEDWSRTVREFVLRQLNVSSSAVFLEHFEGLTNQVQGEGWGWIGLSVFVYTVASLIIKFGRSLDSILISREETPELSVSFIMLTVRRGVVMLGLPVALMLSLAISQWIREDSWLHVVFELRGVGPIAALPVGWLTTVLAVFFIYYFIPSRKVPASQALKASLIVVPISEILRWGLGFYNKYAIGTSKLYGVLAVIPLFILWVQLNWELLLIGALTIRLKKPKKKTL